MVTCRADVAQRSLKDGVLSTRPPSLKSVWLWPVVPDASPVSFAECAQARCGDDSPALGFELLRLRPDYMLQAFNILAL